MKIKDIKCIHIPVFENEDIKINKLYSFFLHYAPRIDSSTSYMISDKRLQQNWSDFMNITNLKHFKIYSSVIDNNKLIKNNIDDNQEVNRRCLAIVCTRKNKNETDCESCFRHIRNILQNKSDYI